MSVVHISSTFCQFPIIVMEKVHRYVDMYLTLTNVSRDRLLLMTGGGRV